MFAYLVETEVFIIALSNVARLVHPLLQNSSANWNETEWVRPFKVNCIPDAITSRRCQRCRHTHDKCEPVIILIS